MSKAIVLLWLGTGSQAAFDADLDGWARARFARLEAPPADAPAGLGYDESIAQAAEELLEQARIAAASLDVAAAGTRLAETDALLRKHPELPQAAWLMAERLRIEAGLLATSAPFEAAKLEARARAFEGSRAAAFGAPGFAVPDAPPRVPISLSGVHAGDELDWDGRKTASRFDTVPGEHHLRVIRRERVVWAGFVKVAAGNPTLRVRVPPPVPCSFDDLGSPTIRGERAVPSAGVRCERWAIARPAAAGGVEVASCTKDRCGALVRWQKHFGVTYAGPPQPAAEPGFPTWAALALAGAGAAALSGVILWRAGAFDEREPGKTGWEFYGPRAPSAK